MFAGLDFLVFFLSQENVFDCGFNLFHTLENYSRFLKFIFVSVLEEVFDWNVFGLVRMCSFYLNCQVCLLKIIHNTQP